MIGTNIFFFILIGCLFVQLFYYLFFFRKLYTYTATSKKVVDKSLPPLSILICARNEAFNLKKNLPYVLSQNYPNYEVIVVNHASSDETNSVLQAFKADYPHLRVVEALDTQDIYLQGKRAALIQGINKAQYNTLLLTDADCRPKSMDWAKHMVCCTFPSNSLVLGYAPYIYKPTYLNAFIRFETMYTALQYLSFALRGMTYMGVGRNILYQKCAFSSHMLYAKTLSGDDDLFIQKMTVNNQKSHICIDSDSFVYSRAALTWSAWWKQKLRHQKAGFHYKAKYLLCLGFLQASHMLFWVCVLGLVFVFPFWVGGILFVRYLAVGYVWTRIHIIFREKKNMYLWILFDFIYPLYFALLSVSSFFNKQRLWK